MDTRTKKLWNRDYILLFLAMVLMTTALTMNSAVITPYVVSMGQDLTVAGTIAGIMTIASMAARPLSGILGDIMVKKRVVFSTTSLAAVGALMMAFPIPVIALGIVRAVFGILFSISTTVMMAMIPDCVPEGQVGAALGYYGVGLGVAQAIGPSIGFWVANCYGYPAVYVLAGALILASACCVAKLPAVAVRTEPKRSRLTLKRMIAPELLPLIPGCFCIGAVLGVENSFLALYAESNGIANVGWYFTLYGAAMIGIRLLCGKFMDRLPFTLAYYGGLTAIAATMLLFGAAEAVGFVPILLLTVLVRAAGIGIVQPVLQSACLRSVSPAQKSVASGMYYLGSDLGMGLTPILGAKLCGLYSGSYPKMFATLVALPILSGILFAPFRDRILKNTRIES